MSEFNQIKYQNEYNKQKYDRTTIMTAKGKKDQIKALAASSGLSVNEFINKAIDAYIQANYTQTEYMLNSVGKEKAAEYVSDLADNEKYTKDTESLTG